MPDSRRIRGILPPASLVVADHPHQVSVHFHKARVDFRAVIGFVFHVFAAVHQAGQDLAKVIDLLLVKRNQAGHIFGGKCRFLGFRHPEELGIVCRHILHIIFEPIQNPFSSS